MKIHRLDHIHVYCSDPDASLRFYVEVFDAEGVQTAHGPDGGVRHLLRVGGFTLVLAPYPEGTAPAFPARIVSAREAKKSCNALPNGKSKWNLQSNGVSPISAAIASGRRIFRDAAACGLHQIL